MFACVFKTPGSLFVALLSALTLTVAGAAAAGPVIDQEQPVFDTTAGFVYAIGGPSEQKLAQVVTPGLTGTLAEVRLVAACENDLTVEVQGVTGGFPNGTVLGAQTVQLPGPFPSTFRSILFSTPVPVTAGIPYALVLTTSGSCGISPGPVGNPYAGGSAYFDSRPNPPGWLPLSIGDARSDLPFQTLVEPVDGTPPTVRCVATTNHPAGHMPRGRFFQLFASDDVGVRSIVLADSRSSFVSMHFANGDKVTITRAPSATPNEKRPGPDGTVSHVKVQGDAILRVTDTSGNVAEVACHVPPHSG